jgi:hypothetical protein
VAVERLEEAFGGRPHVRASLEPDREVLDRLQQRRDVALRRWSLRLVAQLGDVADEPVPRATHGRDVRGRPRIVVQLAAQPGLTGRSSSSGVVGRCATLTSPEPGM